MNIYDIIPGPDLVAEDGDGPLELFLGCGVLPHQGRRIVLEELLLPLVEQGGGELMLIGEVGDGEVVDQMTPEDGDLLDMRRVLSGLSHGQSPAER